MNVVLAASAGFADQITCLSFVKWLQGCLTVSHGVLLDIEELTSCGVSAFFCRYTRRSNRSECSMPENLKYLYSIVPVQYFNWRRGTSMFMRFWTV